MVNLSAIIAKLLNLWCHYCAIVSTICLLELLRIHLNM